MPANDWSQKVIKKYMNKNFEMSESTLMREIKSYKITISQGSKRKERGREMKRKKLSGIMLFVHCMFRIPREKIKY